MCFPPSPRRRKERGILQTLVSPREGHIGVAIDLRHRSPAGLGEAGEGRSLAQVSAQVAAVFQSAKTAEALQAQSCTRCGQLSQDCSWEEAGIYIRLLDLLAGGTWMAPLEMTAALVKLLQRVMRPWSLLYGISPSTMLHRFQVLHHEPGGRSELICV